MELGMHKLEDNTILKRVEKCGKDLSWWNLNVFGNFKKELEKKKNSIVTSGKRSFY